jgi:hypothetical protein
MPGMPYFVCIVSLTTAFAIAPGSSMWAAMSSATLVGVPGRQHRFR